MKMWSNDYDLIVAPTLDEAKKIYVDIWATEDENLNWYEITDKKKTISIFDEESDTTIVKTVEEWISKGTNWIGCEY